MKYTLTAAAVVVSLCVATLAQCPRRLVAAAPAGSMYPHCCIDWDADGDGPALSLVVAGGIATTDCVMSLDPRTSTWASIGASQLSGQVYAIASIANDRGGNDLFAGGKISVTSEGRPGNIARWDGRHWTSVGGGFLSGPTSSIRALAVSSDGLLYAGLEGEHAGSIVKQFDGQTWSPVGNCPLRAVFALVFLPNGHLLAAGSSDGGTLVQSWDGQAWSAFSPDSPSSRLLNIDSQGWISALISLPDGRLVAGGNFYLPDHGNRSHFVALWDQLTWKPITNGLHPAQPSAAAVVYDLAFLPNTSGGHDILAVGIFDGTDRSMTQTGLAAIRNSARWDGTNWHTLVSAENVGVRCIAVLPTGDVAHVGGDFASLSVWTRRQPCIANFNCVGAPSDPVDARDLHDFLHSWFLSFDESDINYDNRIEVQDIFDFLTAWFAGC